MERITWKNIDAPDFNSAGNLMGGFASSLGQLGQDLRDRADRRRAQGIDSYSADALMKLAGVRDQAQFDALRQGLDGSKMSTPALDLFFQHPGLLLEREKLGTEIAGQRIQNDGRMIQNTGFQLDNDEQQITNADLQGDLEAERQGRANQTQFNPIRTRMVQMAATGDLDGAMQLGTEFATQFPSAAGLVASTQEELGRIGADYQTRRGNEDAYDQTIAGRERSNRALTYTQKAGRTFPTKEAAIAFANRDSSIESPEDLKAILAEISNVPDEQWMPVDPDAPEAFPNWAGRTGVAARDIWQSEQTESAAALAQIESAQKNNNAYQFKVLQDDITAKHGDKSITDVPAVLKGMGFDDGYVRTANEDVKWVADEMRKIDSAVSPQAVLAAVIQMRNTGFINSDQNFVDNEEAAVQLLKDMIDPAKIKAETVSGMQLEGFRKDLADRVTQIEAQRDTVRRLRASNSPLTVEAQERLDGMAQQLEVAQNAWAAELQKRSDKAGKITRDENGVVTDSPQIQADKAAAKNKEDASLAAIQQGGADAQNRMEVDAANRVWAESMMATGQDNQTAAAALARRSEQNAARRQQVLEEARSQPGLIRRFFNF